MIPGFDTYLFLLLDVGNCGCRYIWVHHWIASCHHHIGFKQYYFGLQIINRTYN